MTLPTPRPPITVTRPTGEVRTPGTERVVICPLGLVVRERGEEDGKGRHEARPFKGET